MSIFNLIQNAVELGKLLENNGNPSYSQEMWHIVSIRVWGKKRFQDSYIIGSFKTEKEAKDMLDFLENHADLSKYTTVHFQYKTSRWYQSPDYPPELMKGRPENYNHHLSGYGKNY